MNQGAILPWSLYRAHNYFIKSLVLKLKYNAQHVTRIQHSSSHQLKSSTFLFRVLDIQIIQYFDANS